MPSTLADTMLTHPPSLLSIGEQHDWAAICAETCLAFAASHLEELQKAAEEEQPWQQVPWQPGGHDGHRADGGAGRSRKAGCQASLEEEGILAYCHTHPDICGAAGHWNSPGRQALPDAGVYVSRRQQGPSGIGCGQTHIFVQLIVF